MAKTPKPRRTSKSDRSSASGEWMVRDPPFKPTRFTVRQIRAAVRKVVEAQKGKPT